MHRFFSYSSIFAFFKFYFLSEIKYKNKTYTKNRCNNIFRKLSLLYPSQKLLKFRPFLRIDLNASHNKVCKLMRISTASHFIVFLLELFLTNLQIGQVIEFHGWLGGHCFQHCQPHRINLIFMNVFKRCKLFIP